MPAVSRQRTRELESFTANRAEAIRHHAGRIEEINSREVKAAQEWHLPKPAKKPTRRRDGGKRKGLAKGRRLFSISLI
jgi:hypothetical protein